MMPDRNGLGTLKVSVSSDRNGRILSSLTKKGFHDSLESFTQLGASVFKEKSHVCGDLVVSTSTGM